MNTAERDFFKLTAEGIGFTVGCIRIQIIGTSSGSDSRAVGRAADARKRKPLISFVSSDAVTFQNAILQIALWTVDQIEQIIPLTRTQ